MPVRSSSSYDSLTKQRAWTGSLLHQEAHRGESGISQRGWRTANHSGLRSDEQDPQRADPVACKRPYCRAGAVHQSNVRHRCLARKAATHVQCRWFITGEFGSSEQSFAPAVGGARLPLSELIPRLKSAGEPASVHGSRTALRTLARGYCGF
jgi:hypothetical protein